MRDQVACTCAMLGAVLLAACGGDSDLHPCNLTGDSGCHDGRVCEEVAGDQPTCFARVVVQGSVTDLTTSAPLNGARVVGMDSSGAPDSTVGVTGSDGGY